MPEPEIPTIVETPTELASTQPTSQPIRRSHSRTKPVKKESLPAKVVKEEKADPNVPWVIMWGAKNENNRVIIGCERCGARLSFPYKTPVHQIEMPIYGFRMDHQGCKEGDKPKGESPPSTTLTRRH